MKWRCFHCGEVFSKKKKAKKHFGKPLKRKRPVCYKKMDKRTEVLEMIAKDMKDDAKNFDGRSFNGKTVAEYFGNHGAAISALADMIKSMNTLIQSQLIWDMWLHTLPIIIIGLLKIISSNILGIL